jgi:pimeloyl-ACP methyl ester carboxylesterase
MLKERKIRLGAVEINYAEGPKSGAPLVLLHGLPGRWQELLPIMPTLILQWHVHALDFRGQGKSRRVPDQYLSKYYIADVADFIQQLFDEPTFLFGHSAGGMAALGAAAQLPGSVRAVIVGDSPIDLDVLVGWMTSEGFKGQFSALQKIAGLKDRSIREIEREIGNISIQVPGQDTVIRYGDSPGVDAVHIQQLAITLSQMDPGVLEYHATGRAMEFLDGFDLDEILEKIACPILLLQGNPKFGGMMTSEVVNHVKSSFPGVGHAFLEAYGHGLGLDTWDVEPLLRSMTSFLDSA